MLGRQNRNQEDLFIYAPFSSLIPDDHILKKVDKFLDLSWLREELKDVYCSDNGRPGIDPEAVVRLMLAGFFEGIVHDRKLMRQAQVNIAMRWFAGYRLDETLPHHSSLTKIRQRWGSEKFKKIFLKTIQSCIDAGLVNGDTVHVDATLIRADVSWESLTTEYADKVIAENQDAVNKKPKKRSTTDFDATMATSKQSCRLEPSFKQHGAVDDKCGVIVDVDISTGEDNEGSQLPEQVERIESNTGKKIETVTADAGYAHGSNFQYLEERNIDAVIPTQRQSYKSDCIPKSKFKYDSKNNIVKCPAGKILKPGNPGKDGTIYRACQKDCGQCKLRKKCFGSSAKAKTIKISPYEESLLRARRRHKNPDDKFIRAYSRHRFKIEGMHGEAKQMHGLRRAVRRGIENMKIQAYFTAAVINLKRLASFGTGLLEDILMFLVEILLRALSIVKFELA
ncbi:MAG: transposase [Sedimentisphaeraceae bacterium JB056]